MSGRCSKGAAEHTSKSPGCACVLGGEAPRAPEKWKNSESPGCVFHVSSCIWYLRAPPGCYG